MEKYFNIPENLEDMKKVQSGPGYFAPGGDLTESSDNYLKPAGDLTESSDNYLKPAGDIEEKKEDVVDEINDYLSTVVSGEKFGYECSLGTLVAGGQSVVSFYGLKKMVAEGYNIVKAECLNPNMIVVEYQLYKKNNGNTFGR